MTAISTTTKIGNAVFNRTTIQIQLGMDEFEPCSALRTKTGSHKMLGVYMQIRNIDPQHKSKLENIHLVALIKSEDLKSGDDSFDKIASKIVNELKVLETEGMTIRDDVKLKAILVNISADNLGANGVFGFVECFVANYFCRICELNRDECKTNVEEIPIKMRQMAEKILTTKTQKA